MVICLNIEIMPKYGQEILYGVGVRVCGDVSELLKFEMGQKLILFPFQSFYKPLLPTNIHSFNSETKITKMHENHTSEIYVGAEFIDSYIQISEK